MYDGGSDVYNFFLCEWQLILQDISAEVVGFPVLLVGHREIEVSIIQRIMWMFGFEVVHAHDELRLLLGGDSKRQREQLEVVVVLHQSFLQLRFPIGVESASIKL